MKPGIFILYFVFTLSASVCFGQDTAALNYIKGKAVKLDTDFDKLNDLNGLKGVFANRRIIGMGEATHGTYDFQLAKFRMFKFLVTQMNYRIFGIEANFTQCRQINDYVLYGKGDIEKVMGEMRYWAWETREMLRMVQWMREYNTTRPDGQKVKFYGFDMASDEFAEQNITKKLEKLDSVDFKARFGLFSRLHILVKGEFTKYDKQKGDSTKAMLVDLKQYVELHEDRLLKLFPAEEVGYLKRDVRLVQQCFDVDEAATLVLRDKYMAENVAWILDHEGKDSKMMLWAHNHHIAKGGAGAQRMGGHLKQKYRDQYYAIGFNFNKGAFRAYGLEKPEIFTVADSMPGSTGALFSQLGFPEFFIDIENAVKTGSPAKKLFTGKIEQRNMPAGFDPNTENTAYYINDPLYDQFDGLIFINETSATVPIN